MLRRILLTSAGALALTGAALAADLPSRAPPPVYLAPPPVFTWTGLYVGINAGYTWSDSKNIDTGAGTIDCVVAGGGCAAAAASAAGATATLPAKIEGFIGGGQIGYNYQFYNSWVVGLEADIQGVATDNGRSTLVTETSIDGFPANSIGTTLSVSRRLEYLGTVRGRLGFTITPTLLVYGTGGLAYGGVKTNTNIDQVINGPSAGIETAFGSFGSFSDTRVGWTAGGGVEWLFAPNWSVKAEYLYYDLGRVTYGAGALVDGLTAGGAFFTNSARSTTRFNGNIARAGLNYHFNLWGPGPIVARY